MTRPQRMNGALMAMVLNAVHDRYAGRVFILQVGSGNGVGIPDFQPRFAEGWSGLLIEPHPTHFAALEALHADSDRVAVLNLGISDVSGNMPLHFLTPEAAARRPRVRPNRASLVRERIALPGVAESEIAAVEVPVLRMDTVLRELGLDSAQLIAVNAGGHEEQVLRSFDIAAMKPALVLVRSPADAAKDPTLIRLLIDAGLGTFRVGPWLMGLAPDLSVPLDDLFTYLKRHVGLPEAEAPSLQPSGILHHADP